MKTVGRTGRIAALLGIILLLAVSTACQNKAARAELEKFRAQAKLQEQNMKTIERYFASADARDFDALQGFYTPATRFFSPAGSTTPMTGDESTRLDRAYAEAIPDLSHRIEEILATGDKVVVRLTTKGTLKEVIEGFPPPGKSFEVSSIYMLTLKDGKIVEGRSDADMLGLMLQLGMELRLKDTGKN